MAECRVGILIRKRDCPVRTESGDVRNDVFYPLNEFLDDLYRAVWFESGKVDVYREALQMKYLECVEKALKRKPGRGEPLLCRCI